jgi:hypothetical protein
LQFVIPHSRALPRSQALVRKGVPGPRTSPARPCHIPGTSPARSRHVPGTSPSQSQRVHLPVQYRSRVHVRVHLQGTSPSPFPSTSRGTSQSHVQLPYRHAPWRAPRGCHALARPSMVATLGSSRHVPGTYWRLLERRWPSTSAVVARVCRCPGKVKRAAARPGHEPAHEGAGRLLPA